MKSQTDKPNAPMGCFSQITPFNGLLRPINVFLGQIKLVSSLGHFYSNRDYLAAVLRLRNRHILLLDIVALLLIPIIAMALRLDGLNLTPSIGRALAIYTVVALTIQLAIFYKMGFYSRFWQYAGVIDLTQVVIAVGVSTALLAILNAGLYASLATRNLATYPSLPLIAGLLTFMAIGGSRFGLRGVYYWHQHRKGAAAKRRTLVAGAGEAGMMVVREIRTNPELNMEVVAFVDDDPQKVGSWIAGLPVVGTLDVIPEVVEDLQIQEIIVAIPTAPLMRQQQIMALSKKSGVSVFSPPGVFELLAGYKTISHVPQIDLQSLLEREPITTDQSDAASVLQGARVLVTGAGGSIGSELCQQIAGFKPAEIILLGHGENSIFQIGLNLRMAFPDLITHSVIADIRDEKGIDWALDKHRPDVVFHAAAHKHVPFMEENASEAITNNVQGTLNLIRSAQRYLVKRFVLISSDKAVNPTSIMGVTKRIAELLVNAAAKESGQAYMAVRFGNVLGSRGSVVPLFQRQIQAGGPLTITHPDMRRYFMTIPEAVQLVLQAGALGSGGQVFTLDMGEQIPILDLATKLISRSGFKLGRDIEIVFTGIRSGEKLGEELFLSSENYARTIHEKVFVAVDSSAIDNRSLYNEVAELIDLAQRRQLEDAIRKMQVIAPSYRPQFADPMGKATANHLQNTTSSMRVGTTWNGRGWMAQV